MSELGLKPLSAFAHVNPSLTASIEQNDFVSFIPMIDLTDSGHWIGNQIRKKMEVSVGFTTFQEGDVLFAKITPCMENGKGCYAEGLVNGVGFGSTEFHVLRPKKGNSGKFLFHWIQSEHLRKKAKTFMIGSAGQQRVQPSFFRNYQIPTLYPKEQRRIAKILDAADEAIAKTEALIEKLKNIKAGLLHDLLTRGLDENGQLRNPIAHPEQFRDSPLGRIPKEWEIVSINDLAVNHDGRRIPLKQANRDKRDGIYPYYGASGIIDWIDDFLFDGDFVLLGEDGANVITREQPLAFRVSGKFWANNHAHVYEPLPGIDIRFLTELLEAQNYQPIIIGSAQPKITQNGLSLLRFVNPRPVEQRKIGDLLEVQDARIRAEEAYLTKLKNIKKGLMHDLLTGRVRVKMVKQEE